MQFGISTKKTTTMLAGGIVERKGDYLVCPECKYDRSFLLTEKELGKQIEWRCPECRTYLGGVIQNDGMVEKISVEPERKWIMIEIDADCEPGILAVWRPQTSEEAVRSTLPSDDPVCFSVPDSFHLEICQTDLAVNPLGLPQYKGKIS